MTGGAESAAQQQMELAQALLDACLPGHGARVDYDLDVPSGTIVIQPAPEAGSTPRVSLTVGGVHTADVTLSIRFRWFDHLDALEVNESRFTLFLADDRQPLVRFEFQEALTATPQSHWHLHAERGSFSALLARAGDNGSGRRDAARLSSLHFPLGGPHFRPSLADVVEFVIVECGVDSLPTWRSAVHEFRKHWRRGEAAATARQFPAETAQALRALGWSVQPPAPAEIPAQFATLAAG
ncbi:hypothetical protein EDF53_3229 [Curtobacterium sp. PhB78]|nr:hypothetical protein EDF53_3229 [Curtobacterium sp. PhB78]